MARNLRTIGMIGWGAMVMSTSCAGEPEDPHLDAAPDKLLAVGVAHYRVSGTPGAGLSVELFDGDRRLMAVALIAEGEQGNAQARIVGADGREEWITSDRTIDAAGVHVVVTASTGTTVALHQGGAELVLVETPTGWVGVETSDAERSADILDARSRLFATPALKVLRATWESLPTLAPEGQNAATASQAPETRPLDADAAELESAGCTVACFPVAWPAYWCDGGGIKCSCSAGSGWFVITGCTFVLPCLLSCASFPSNAT